MRNFIHNTERKKAISFVVLNICAIASYFFLAYVSKKAFTWESPAITLWPSSGLANALAVSYGWNVLPGIVIGNLLGTAFDANTGFSFQAFMLPVAIAAGAQATLIRWILIRRNLLDNSLTRISKLFTFLLWVGPLGNWPTATTFFLYSLIQSDTLLLSSQAWTSSFFWWTGDSLGSLMSFPLLILLLPFHHPIWHERKAYLLSPLLILIAVFFSAAFIEVTLLEKIEITPELSARIQNLRLLSNSAWNLVALGVLGLILQASGKSLEQEGHLSRSRLAADAAGAVIHEIGQPLIRLRLRLERIVDSLEHNQDEPFRDSSSYSELKKQAEQSLTELNSVVLNTRSIQDLTLAGIRDSSSANLKDAITTSSTQLRQELDRLDQDLNISINNQLPNVSARQIQLQAAIRNLLSNASKAAGENGVIRISVSYFSNYVCCEIEDSGNGFNWSRQKKFINQLVKVKPLSIPDGKKRFKSHSKGMGLGLMIVRRVIEDNGGKIQFTNSKELGGAKVKIWLKPS